MGFEDVLEMMLSMLNDYDITGYTDNDLYLEVGVRVNIVLAKAEINYLYYVIMHEYAHTKVFNHSKDFYNLLEKLMPNYKYYDKNIKKLSIWI